MKRTALAGKARTRRVPRDTGPSADVRIAVGCRANDACERCGVFIDEGLQIHHRKPRRMGGSRDPLIGSVSNLVLLCSECHLRGVELHRLQAYRDGYLLHAGDDPQKVPVKIYGRGYVLLTAEGAYAPERPPNWLR